MLKLMKIFACTKSWSNKTVKGIDKMTFPCSDLKKTRVVDVWPTNKQVQTKKHAHTTLLQKFNELADAGNNIKHGEKTNVPSG